MPLLSPGRLLHLVFADANDTYYCNEILALDFHQYLWLKLHEQGFGCVYFLARQDDAVIPDILTYGDDLAKPFKFKSGVFSGKKSAKKSLCEWITKRLSESGKELSAIVCTMEDFCAFFSDPDSKEFLQSISSSKRRCGSIILTSSPEAEESKPLLLQSMAFEYLGEPGIIGVRKAGPCDMYGFIKDSMGEGMVYLNTFTKERLHCLIARLLLEDQKRSENCHLQRHMEDYLLQWMNNHDFRNAEQQRGSRFPSPYVSHLELHNRLNDPAMWSNLSERAERIAQSGGIRAYADLLGCSCVDESLNAVAVRRDRNTTAGKCAALTPSSRIDATDPNYEQIVASLASLRNSACTPKNLCENKEIQGILNEFVLRYNSLCSADRLDTDRILYCVKATLFFAENVYDWGEEGQIKAIRDCAELHRMWLDGCESVSKALRWAIRRMDGPQLRNTSEMVIWVQSVLATLGETDMTSTSIEIFRMRAEDAILTWNTLKTIQTKLGQIESTLITSGWSGTELERLKDLFYEQKAVNDRSDEKTSGLTWDDRY